MREFWQALTAGGSCTQQAKEARRCAGVKRVGHASPQGRGSHQVLQADIQAECHPGSHLPRAQLPGAWLLHGLSCRQAALPGWGVG